MWPRGHRPGSMARLKGRLRGLGERSGRRNGEPFAGDRVVSTMTVAAAGFPLLLDVADLPAGRELAIPADDASAGESVEPEKPDETHNFLIVALQHPRRVSASSVPSDIASSAKAFCTSYRRLIRSPETATKKFSRCLDFAIRSFG